MKNSKDLFEQYKTLRRGDVISFKGSDEEFIIKAFIDVSTADKDCAVLIFQDCYSIISEEKETLKEFSVVGHCLLGKLREL
jgi:hypothetical protein